MENTNTMPIFGIGSTIAFMVMWGILGYFKYDSIHGALGIVLLTFALGICAYIAFIPFCGVAIQTALMHFVIIPRTLTFTGLDGTWLITLIFWAYFVMGAIYTIITSAFVLIYLSRHS